MRKTTAVLLTAVLAVAGATGAHGCQAKGGGRFYTNWCFTNGNPEDDCPTGPRQKWVYDHYSEKRGMTAYRLEENGRA
jgi:hypothetical protein